ncbi:MULTISPECIES: hypothetical protein [unclassified Streptomyces]|uniref:hypothetical protein n=1 Tax=unclassified Streptomyces TaxID=2593676 RepID=UPI0011A626CE|nr:hypothetical protein [Streptomyces sp. CNQ-509]
MDSGTVHGGTAHGAAPPDIAPPSALPAFPEAASNSTAHHWSSSIVLSGAISMRKAPDISPSMTTATSRSPVSR